MARRSNLLINGERHPKQQQLVAATTAVQSRSIAYEVGCPTNSSRNCTSLLGVVAVCLFCGGALFPTGSSAFAVQPSMCDGSGVEGRRTMQESGGVAIIFRSNNGKHLHHHHYRTATRMSLQSAAAAVSVPASQLEQDLNAAERTVVSVVRNTGPSVALVTSILPISASSVFPTTKADKNKNRQQRQSRPRNNSSTSTTTSTNNGLLPRGRNLGSGSGFVVDPQGYIVTNYHVIEPAYRWQQRSRHRESIWNQILGNLTSSSSSSVPSLDCFRTQSSAPTPLVFVRIDSATQFLQCRIVNIQPDLDVAVLKVIMNDEDYNDGTTGDAGENETSSRSEALFFRALTFGSSSDLLVGQSLVAIGNPFGFDNTVTTGVVSALDRELKTSSNSFPMPPLFFSAQRQQQTVIRNCVQTDCAINPGNSGGPLLNLKGQVVGVTTAIVTTSGSNAGIGFAIPADQVAPTVANMIHRDKRNKMAKQQPAMPQKRPAWLGVSVLPINFYNNSNDDSGENSKRQPLNWVVSVAPGSPAAIAGIQSLKLVDTKSPSNGVSSTVVDSSRNDGVVAEYGDAIVAVRGNAVTTFAELQAAVDRCVVGEQLTLTVLNGSTGERRVVYATLAVRP